MACIKLDYSSGVPFYHPSVTRDAIRVPFQRAGRTLIIKSREDSRESALEFSRCLLIFLMIKIQIYTTSVVLLAKLQSEKNNNTKSQGLQMSSWDFTRTALSDSRNGHRRRNPFRHLMNRRTGRQAVVRVPFTTIPYLFNHLNRVLQRFIYANRCSLISVLLLLKPKYWGRTRTITLAPCVTRPSTSVVLSIQDETGRFCPFQGIQLSTSFVWRKMIKKWIVSWHKFNTWTIGVWGKDNNHYAI